MLQQPPSIRQYITLPTKSDHQHLIGPNNEDTVEINGESYRALIDSGSQITSITDDLWRRHSLLRDVNLSSADIKIEGAGGQDVPYLGIVPVSITLLGITYEDVPVFVVPTDSYRKQVPVLIGTNVIRATKKDQRIARGDNFMEELKTENTAWHTAYINTAILLTRVMTSLAK